MAVPYRDIPNELAAMRGFTGNSMGAVEYQNDEAGRTCYIVTSYRTIIGEVMRSPETGRFIHWVSDSYYSPTTSRHQNLCRANLPGQKVSREEYDGQKVRRRAVAMA